MSATENDLNREDEILGKAYDGQLVKRLWGYVGQDRLRIFLAVLVLIAGAGAELAGPVLTRIAIDDYIVKRDWNGLQWIVLAFIGFAFGAAFLRWSETYLTGSAGQRIIYRLRMEVFGKLQKLSMSYYDRNPVGRLLSRVTTDIQALYELFSSGMVAIVGDIVTLLGIMVVMFWINWKLALLTLSVVPLLLLVTFSFRKKVRDLYRTTRLQIARLNAYLHENLVGMKVVQLFGREARNYQKFDEIGSELKETYIKTIFQYAVFFPLVEVISAVAVALIIFGGGNFMLSGVVTLGTLVAFIQYVERFYRPVRDLAEKYNILQSAMAASERVFNVLDHPIDVIPPSAPKFASYDQSMQDRLGISVEFRNVWFAYRGEEWVLKDLSFRVAPGERIAIVGATGAGKTTIISLLSRYYDVQKGEILLDGIDLRAYDLQELRRKMGIVLQDVYVFAGTIGENIRYGVPQATDEELMTASAAVHADKFVNKLPQKYQEPVVERGATLSTGERQLLAFARALICNPRMLILDEATASVDTETERLIQDAIERMLERRTSLIIAHRLSTIQHCDRILVFHHGRLREEGTQEQLLAQRGIYFRLYQLQFGLTSEVAV